LGLGLANSSLMRAYVALIPAYLMLIPAYLMLILNLVLPFSVSRDNSHI
jgi:hypothetical protein